MATAFAYSNQEWEPYGTQDHLYNFSPPGYYQFSDMLHLTSRHIPAEINCVPYSSEEISGAVKVENEKEYMIKKPIELWQSNEILDWISSFAHSKDLLCTEIAGDKFCKFNGKNLVSFSLEQFIKLDDKYGHELYYDLKKIHWHQKHRNQENDDHLVLQHDSSGEEMTYTEIGTQDKTSLDNRYDLNNLSRVLMDHRDEKNVVQPNIADCMGKRAVKIKNDTMEIKKRSGRGRPKDPRKKPKKEKKLGRLWEFIRDLLKNSEYCPKFIAWENHDEGTFRFVQSDKVAKLWGNKKENPEMNYEKLSRAMRYYYKSQVLLPVIGRRLVYKFGPAAEDWKVDNPNFKD